MKKTSFLILFSILIIQSSFGQASSPPPLPTGWERIYIKNVGSFYLPPTMEVQKGKYKEFVDEIKKIKGIDASQLTAQQKGLNEFGKEGFEKYARVMVETTFGSPGDFEKFNFNLAEITQADIAELGTIYKQQIQQSFLGTGLKLIEWYSLKVEKINGVSCIHISYKRQLQDEPFVLVHIYSFHNNDRVHNLTLSYRLSEADYWKADFATILKSFRITNIR
ncbi:MAG: hypothetical protein LBM07_09030 [Culturomica sp.]|jgi:hypothetical protein|nr:hypothetical protein [Culturomica sp.]